MKQLDMGWYEKANCKGLDAKIFFPDIPVGCNHKNAFDEALKVCGLCPVRKPCLALAM